VPGIYQVRLTVDGKAQDQPLKVVMDPRSPATAEVLAQQLRLGQQIFGETIAARRALAEIESVQKQLTELGRSSVGKMRSCKRRWRRRKRRLERFSSKRKDMPRQAALGCRTRIRRWHRLCAWLKTEIAPRLRKRLRFTRSRAGR